MNPLPSIHPQPPQVMQYTLRQIQRSMWARFWAVAEIPQVYVDLEAPPGTDLPRALVLKARDSAVEVACSRPLLDSLSEEESEVVVRDFITEVRTKLAERKP